ncbi:MAG: GNAT family protein, partial [Halalkalicoccus sp.]
TAERDDVEIIQRAYNEPDFQQGFVIEFPKNRAVIEERIEQGAKDEDGIHLIICVDGTPVGNVSLKDMRRLHGMLAYWLLPDKRGQGYATESAALLLDHAFDTIGLHRVFAWTIDDNEASQKVLGRLGFAHEGTYREHVFMRGEYHDTEHYGILSSEWDGVESALEDCK